VNQLFYTDNANSGLAPNLTNQGTFTAIVTNKLGSNASAAGGLGNMIVDYDITFFMAQDDFPVPPSIVSGALKMTGAGGTFGQSNPLGDSPTINFNTTQLTFQRSASFSLLLGFPPGTTRWLLTFALSGTGFASDPAIILVSYSDPNHGTTVNQISYMKTQNGGATYSTGSYLLDVKNNGPNAGWASIYQNPGTFTTITASSIVLVSVNVNLSTHKSMSQQFEEKIEEKVESKLQSQIEALTNRISRLSQFAHYDDESIIASASPLEQYTVITNDFSEESGPPEHKDEKRVKPVIDRSRSSTPQKRTTYNLNL